MLGLSGNSWESNPFRMLPREFAGKLRVCPGIGGAFLPRRTADFAADRLKIRADGRKRRQTACKPGSVHPLPGWMTIPLGRPLRGASRDRPGQRSGNGSAGCPACHPYLVLLPVGLAMPGPLPAPRCALAAPFHPCLAKLAIGGLFSVALSLGSPPPGVTRHRVSVEPGLSSPGLAPRRGHPAV